MSRQAELKPFHESIVRIINGVGVDEAPFSSYDMMRVLAILLKETKIPKGHDEIIAAWKAKSRHLVRNDDMGVVESILAQKKTAEEAEAKKKLEAYAVGKKPPGLSEDGSFETPLGVRAFSIVAANGDMLVVDKETGLFVQDIADEDD